MNVNYTLEDFLNACSQNDCERLRQLIIHNCPKSNKGIDILASKNDAGNAIQLLLHNGCRATRNSMARAAENGFIDYLRLFANSGFQFDKLGIIIAGMNGHIDCMNFINEVGFNKPAGYDKMGELFMNQGKFEAFKFVVENNICVNRVNCLQIAQLLPDRRYCDVLNA